MAAASLAAAAFNYLTDRRFAGRLTTTRFTQARSKTAASNPSRWPHMAAPSLHGDFIDEEGATRRRHRLRLIGFLDPRYTVAHNRGEQC